MEDLNVVDSINGAGSWLVANQALLLSYAVNIVAALAIIIVGLIIARMISNAVNRLMISRKIDVGRATALWRPSAPRLSGTFWAQEACWHSQEAWLARFYAASCTRKPIS